LNGQAPIAFMAAAAPQVTASTWRLRVPSCIEGVTGPASTSGRAERMRARRPAAGVASVLSTVAASEGPLKKPSLCVLSKPEISLAAMPTQAELSKGNGTASIVPKESRSSSVQLACAAPE
jgi:hypothetical protein